MANSQECVVTIECSDAEKLVKALLDEKILVVSKGEVNFEEGEFEGGIDYEDYYYTLYNGGCENVSWGLNYIEIAGNARGGLDLDMRFIDKLKEICSKISVELRSVYYYEMDEFCEYYKIVRWPLSDPIAERFNIADKDAITAIEFNAYNDEDDEDDEENDDEENENYIYKICDCEGADIIYSIFNKFLETGTFNEDNRKYVQKYPEINEVAIYKCGKNDKGYQHIGDVNVISELDAMKNK